MAKKGRVVGLIVLYPVVKKVGLWRGVYFKKPSYREDMPSMFQ